MNICICMQPYINTHICTYIDIGIIWICRYLRPLMYIDKQIYFRTKAIFLILIDPENDTAL
jgi:hypothetical protein